MAQANFYIIIKILDSWTEINKNWDYTEYTLCEIADRLYLLEKEI